MIRVALIGCGNISKAHARGYQAHPEMFQVIAVCDPEEKLAQERAQPFSARVFSDWQEVIALENIDAVDICLPHDLHCEVAVSALKAGKHVLVEKPMATNLKEAKRMVSTARSTGRVLMVAQCQRYSFLHRKIKDLITQGVIGDIICVRADCNQFLAGILPPGHWLYSRQRAGGGVVISVAVHRLDLLRWLVGDIRRVSAFQKISGVNPGMDCEDVSCATLEFEKGAIGEIVSLYAAKKPPLGTFSELLILYGTHGTLHNLGGWYLWSEKDSRYQSPEGGFVPLSAPNNDVFEEEIVHFGNALLQGFQPLTSGEDNLKTMATIEAIYQSAERGVAITVGDLLD